MNENQFGHIFMPFCYSNYLVMKHWSRPEDEARLFELVKPYVLISGTNTKLPTGTIILN